MNQKAALKVLCLTAIGAPPILAATQGLDIPPVASAVMAILALAAGYTLSELEPGFRSGARVEPADQLVDKIFRLPPTERKYLADQVEHRARGEAAGLIGRQPEWLDEGRG